MAVRYRQPCPVARTLELVGERWTLLIVRDLVRQGPRRFQDLLASLRGIAPNLLSERLKAMEARGLVTRTLYSEHPPRASYALTERGSELHTVVAALAIWGARHAYPAAAVVHADCGTPVELGCYCPACDARVSWSAVSVRRAEGPARRPATGARRRPARRATGRAAARLTAARPRRARASAR